ncbi:MAG: polysaccharide biosynthesis protein, partial [Bacteroidales bacterium]|nr:polysaccharide biosynthesis protein [Bacteroidales bacterium]
MFNLEQFIAHHITRRKESLFSADLQNHLPELSERIAGQSVLVIGGAGTIGSSFIKALLPFRPSRLVVIDTSENGLTELTRDLRSTHALYVPNDYKTYPV